MKRKWATGQRNFVQGKRIIETSEQKPVETYEENGVKIKVYAINNAGGLANQQTARSNGLEKGFMKL